MINMIFKPEEEQSRILFEFMYEGFVIGGNLGTDARNLKMYKREEKILSKFEAISFECKNKKTFIKDEVKRFLKNEPELSLELGGDEFDLIVNRIEAVPWGCGMKVTRQINKVIEYLRSLEA